MYLGAVSVVSWVLLGSQGGSYSVVGSVVS